MTPPIKWFYSFIKKYRSLIFGGLFLTTVVSALSMVNPVIYGMIVDEVIAYIKSTGCHYEVGPFETVVEGEFDILMNIIKRCTEIPVELGAPAVKAYVKINHNPSGVLTINEKIDKYR